MAFFQPEIPMCEQRAKFIFFAIFVYMNFVITMLPEIEEPFFEKKKKRHLLELL